MSAQAIIREFKKSDAAAFQEAVLQTSGEAYKWLPWCHPGYTIDEAREWIAMQSSFREAGHEFNFLIVDRNTDTILGGTGLNYINAQHKFCFLGYWVRTGYTGIGIGTAAALQTARFAFDEVGLNRVEILMATENQASRRVAEKTGAKYEGVAKQKLFLHGSHVDAHVFAMLRSEYISGFIF